MIAKNITYQLQYDIIYIMHYSIYTYIYIQSFRNLDAALRQAEQNSLSELSYNHTDTSNTTSQLYEAINGLDDDTARAIQQSLNNDTDKNMFESFRNLSGELGQAKHNSLSDMGQEFESFRNLGK